MLSSISAMHAYHIKVNRADDIHHIFGLGKFSERSQNVDDPHNFEREIDCITHFVQLRSSRLCSNHLRLIYSFHSLIIFEHFSRM